jgi:hypothetical protein
MSGVVVSTASAEECVMIGEEMNPTWVRPSQIVGIRVLWSDTAGPNYHGEVVLSGGGTLPATHSYHYSSEGTAADAAECYERVVRIMCDQLGWSYEERRESM